jgi:hypothetical protein
MGHERAGVLPKTQRWVKIVTGIQACSGTDFDVSGVAGETVKNVRHRFRQIEQDAGTKAAFRFLVDVALAARAPDSQQLVRLTGDVTQKITPIKLASSLRRETAQHNQKPEYTAIAEAAASDALALWYEKHRPQTLSLFESFNSSHQVWQEAGTGAGFCELARLFFAKHTERYLNYFLEREASDAFENVSDRHRFKESVEAHVDSVSQHAFETARITQSFAAGWFNKRIKEGPPTDTEIEGFLSVAFGKMRDELLREVS